MPQPYSSETGRRVDYLARHAREQNAGSLLRRYGSISVGLLPHSAYRHALLWRYGPFWKELLHFPEVPRVEGDRILVPADPAGKVHAGSRVVNSLDGYPPRWNRGECVLRRIDPHWFINMCAGAI
jgi:hypothetical protein